VRDVWEREYLGLYVALFTAKHVEPHEARQAPPAPPPLRIACPRSPPPANNALLQRPSPRRTPVDPNPTPHRRA
jgi:hypothetical protein